ncbi:MAG: adenylate/guanylate cyclase domain-containing protein, partial [Aurantibacter sp.]
MTLIEKFVALGHHPDDTDSEKLKKSTLLVMSSPFAVAGLIWGLIYFFNGYTLPGLIPFSYSLLSISSIIHFGLTKKYSFFRSSQLLLILVLPFALQISLGGFIPGSAVIMWAIICPLGALVFLGRKASLKWFIAFILLVVIAYLVNDKLSEYFDWGIADDFINALFLMNIIGISLLVFAIQYYFVSKRTLFLKLLEDKNQWIKDAFSAYVSPNLVNHLLKNPEELKLGGERRECTFVFTDLVGFTPLIEKSDPETLVADLNEYFEGMIDIVFRHEGTVSKIVGDAITVMFSAPVIQEDHAERAVACALEMDAYAQNFAAEKQKKGIDMGRTRIGVNTGNVIIGNMGSKNQLDYRALGDAINTAARLESANKQLGTRVCVSETTVEQ